MRSVSLVTMLMFAACNGEAPVEEGPEVHACEHRAEAGTPITASADPATAPAITVGEEPYTVTLVDGAPGYVAVTVDQDTLALLFAGTADVITSLQHDGAPEDLPAPAPNEACPADIPEHFDLDLHAGTWHIGVGPAGVPDLWLMLTSAEGHAHDEGEE